MKVSECYGCRYCERRVWSSSYKPANYHEVGVSHAYRYCTLNKARCLKVKFCASYTKDDPVDDAYAAHVDIYV